jgi:ribosome-binding factor A
MGAGAGRFSRDRENSSLAATGYCRVFPCPRRSYGGLRGPSRTARSVNLHFSSGRLRWDRQFRHMTRRTDQVASLIQQELGQLLLGLELPAMTTISRVEVTPDLKHAKIWITVFTEDARVEADVLKSLGSEMYDLQGELNKALVMHHAPRIHFAVDNSQHYASRINELLKKASGDASDEAGDGK